ncbi:MAG: septation protein SpoVG family protein, partial [Chloroflexota bacterium]
KGFKIVDGNHGPFVGMPSQKSSDGEYYDTVFAEAEAKGELTRVAMEAYGGDVIRSFERQPDYREEEAPPFSDDDIPF